MKNPSNLPLGIVVLKQFDDFFHRFVNKLEILHFFHRESAFYEYF